MTKRIYTRTGDAGDTALFGGRRVAKCDARIEACGDVDELNCALGIIRAGHIDPDLDEVLATAQSDLFLVGADLAAPYGDCARSTVPRLDPSTAGYLEAAIDRLDADLEPLTRFILPGGAAAAASIHLARAICRRAERRVVAVSQVAQINPEIVRYLNRLADALFVMARAANHRAGVPDVPWVC